MTFVKHVEKLLLPRSIILNTYNQVHTNERFKCDQCDQDFQFLKGIKRHKSSKHEAQIFKCESCGLECSTKSNLSRHIATNHGQNSSFSCIKCRKEFSNYVELNFRNHFDSCRGKTFDSTKLKCTICLTE